MTRRKRVPIRSLASERVPQHIPAVESGFALEPERIRLAAQALLDPALHLARESLGEIGVSVPQILLLLGIV